MSSLLVKFIDWRYSQSCWYFRPLLWTSAPLTFSLVRLLHPLPPLPCVNMYCTGVCIFIQFVTGGGGLGCVESIYKSYTLSIWPDSEPTIIALPPQGVSESDRWTSAARSLYRSIFKKCQHLGFCVFIVIWSMVREYRWTKVFTEDRACICCRRNCSPPPVTHPSASDAMASSLLSTILVFLLCGR